MSASARTPGTGKGAAKPVASPKSARVGYAIALGVFALVVSLIAPSSRKQGERTRAQLGEAQALLDEAEELEALGDHEGAKERCLAAGAALDHVEVSMTRAMRGGRERYAQVCGGRSAGRRR